MDINFSIDFDRDEVHVLIDHSLSLTIIRDDDSYSYRGFDKIDDEDVQAKLKRIAKIIFELEEL